MGLQILYMGAVRWGFSYDDNHFHFGADSSDSSVSTRNNEYENYTRSIPAAEWDLEGVS